jgi:hypothetical protein
MFIFENNIDTKERHHLKKAYVMVFVGKSDMNYRGKTEDKSSLRQ